MDMRRAFTLQMHDQPVHGHECPRCKERHRCRLPKCSIVWVRLHTDAPMDLGADRECEDCRHELLRQDIPIRELAQWCEHCGSDVATNRDWQNDWNGDHAPLPHNPWCLAILTDDDMTRAGALA